MKLCPLCRCEAFRRFGLGHTIIWVCSAGDCGLQFAIPQLDADALAHAYTKHYYPSKENGNIAVYENTPEEILRQTFDEANAQFGPLAGKRLLDFGCGVGRLCQIAREYGLWAAGIEPDANARNMASQAGHLSAYGDLDSLREAQPSAKFDIVTMWDVIEHLREPWRELEKLASLLRADGWLLVSTPNVASLRARLQRGRWENMVNPTHFYYFTRKSLKAVLRLAGFSEVTELRFPIRYPGHAMVRRLVHRALVSCRLQGQLVFLARPRISATNRPFELESQEKRTVNGCPGR